MVSALAQMLPASLYRASAPGAAPAEPARPAEPSLAAALLANARETPLIAAPMEKKIKLYSPEFYTACTIGGILSCGLTHTAVTPLDVVKCNMQARLGPRLAARWQRAGAEGGWPVQIDPVKYKSISEGFKLTVREAGTAGLFRGWFPTLLGYSVQGAGKFGLYEYFKKCGPVACAAPPALIGAGAALQRLRTAPSPARRAPRHDYAGGARAGSTPTWPARRTPRGTRRVSSWQARRPPSSSPTLACARSRRSRCARTGAGAAAPAAIVSEAPPGVRGRTAGRGSAGAGEP